jgi:pSer/pThr/pTyr-binding forkhead associated (FHA) protein
MNGVFVNRQRVHQAALQDGDTVAFGSARYQFRIGSDPSRDH